jgi:hypothetical protein
MLDEVNLEEAGGHGGVLEPGEDRDGTVEEADGFGTGGTAELHALPGRMQEAVDGAGTDFFEFTGDRIGHMVFLSQSDKVKILPEERGEQFSAGPVEVLPQQFEHGGYRGVIVGLVDPFFPASFNRGDLNGLAVQGPKLCFSDTVKLEDRVFPAFAA